MKSTKHTGACELWGSVAVNSTVSWDMMLCSLLEIHRHFGGISVNYYQITWSHMPGFCILYEGHCGAVVRIPLLLWSSWYRCYLQLTVQAVVLQWWHCSSVPGRSRDFLLFISVRTDCGVNPASYPMVKQREEVKLTTHLCEMPKNAWSCTSPQPIFPSTSQPMFCP